MRRGPGTVTLVAAILVALGLAGPAGATMDQLITSCEIRDAADADTANGNALPYHFCDDGLPSAGGRMANEGSDRALPVPQRYQGHSGLPAPAPAESGTGADAGGRIALDADVSIPAGEPPPRGFPLVVMMHTCCSGDKQELEAETIDGPGERWHYSNAWYASRGNVVLNYTSRGFVDAQGRGSTGETQFDSRDYEVNDYQQLACLLADEPTFDIDPRRVAVTGGSYGGGLAWMALTDPRWDCAAAGRPDLKMRLALAAPKYAWTDLAYALVENGAHLEGSSPPTDPAFSGDEPLGFPKLSILAGLYVSGKVGIPALNEGAHATFPSSIDEAFTCLNGPEPFESSPLCGSVVPSLVEAFRRERSAYYQNHFFSALAAGRARPIPVFSMPSLTSPLFGLVEHERMVSRLRQVVPDYPVAEFYGDFGDFTQNKAAEWADLCGEDHHPCAYTDPEPRVAVGATTRLNRFLERSLRPRPAAFAAPRKMRTTVSLQVCPENAASPAAAALPGERFRGPSLAALAPHRLVIEANGGATTTSEVEPNQHALNADPIANFAANAGRCPVIQGAAGLGVATYDSAPLPSAVTMIGRSRATVSLASATGSDLKQLNARLYDLFPDGRQVLVDRGVRSFTGAPESLEVDLRGSGWRFEAGHALRLELAQDDDPYVKSSVLPSTLSLSRVTLSIPIREESQTLAGSPATAR